MASNAYSNRSNTFVEVRSLMRNFRQLAVEVGVCSAVGIGVGFVTFHLATQGKLGLLGQAGGVAFVFVVFIFMLVRLLRL